MALKRMENRMNKTLIVTGGSRGVGAAIAQRAALDLGFKVVVNFAQSRDRAQALARSIRDQGGQAEPIRADISTEQGIVALFDEAEHKLGPIGAVVNNAGGGLGRWPIETVSADHVAAMMALNLTSVIFSAREAARRMVPDPSGAGGVILNISSMSAANGGALGLSTYAAAKGGVESLTIALANELGPRNIRVNCLRLGPIETDAHGAADAQARAAMTRTVPLGRYGTPNEAASAALFLLSAEAGFVNGAILDVSGGRR